MCHRSDEIRSGALGAASEEFGNIEESWIGEQRGNPQARPLRTGMVNIALAAPNGVGGRVPCR